MDESRRARKARQRWEREMLRRLEELDDLDRRYGLGASPTSHPPARPRHRGMPRVERHKRGTTNPVLPGLLVVLCLLVFLFFKSPTTTGERLRQFVDGLSGGDESYKFVARGPDNLPVGWDPCEPIHYVVNPEGAPDDWVEIVGDAVSEIEDASGFELEADGISTDTSSDRRAEGARRELPVLIDWATPDEVPSLRGDTVGIGGSSAVTRNGETRFVTGVVVLDEDEYDRMQRLGRDRDASLILAHELGHVLGLDHVDDQQQLMNPSYIGQRGFGDGDRAGFAVLGDMPCA
ncbi:matrixin family metalloprotease [Nocardioides dilutus]